MRHEQRTTREQAVVDNLEGRLFIRGDEHLVHCAEEITVLVGGDLGMVREDRIECLYRPALGDDGLRVDEVCVADGQTSRACGGVAAMVEG